MTRKNLCLLAFAAIAVTVTLVMAAKISHTQKRQIIAPEFLIRREMLPFSKELGSGVIARYSLYTNEIQNVVSWYKQNGFTIGGSVDGIDGEGINYPNYMFVIHTFPVTNGLPDIVIWYSGKN
jgi:hypothetical protein